jgi:hypothetical protein
MNHNRTIIGTALLALVAIYAATVAVYRQVA